MDSLIFDRTNSDVRNKTSKGYYNYTDLNRIEEWTQYLAGVLVTAGYSIPTMTFKTDWSKYDMPTEANMERIRTNIKTLRQNYYQGTAIYSNLKKMTYQKANNIEKILNELNNFYESMVNSYVRCGVARMGQSRVWQQRFRKFYAPRNYLASTGTQYINTGFYANNNTRIELKVMPIGISSGEDWQCIFSSKTSYLVNEYVVQINKENSNWYSAFGTNKNQFSSATDNTQYTIDKNKNVTTINSVTDTLTDETFSATQPGYIFADNESGATHFFTGRLYYLKIYDNGTLVRDFIPAVDGNNVAGLYDKVGDIFYYNQGTGSFSVG